MSFRFAQLLAWPALAVLTLVSPGAGILGPFAPEVARAAENAGDGARPDRDGDGLADEDEALHRTSPDNPDSDGDGLLDGWEVDGCPRCGITEPLGVYGAHPLVKDVFVEIDWMETSTGSPSESALIAYQAAVDIHRVFRRSGTGIQVHFDLGPRIEDWVPSELLEEDAPDFSRFAETTDPGKVIPYQDRLPKRPASYGASSLRSLYDIYNDARYFRPSRRNLFYYILIAERRGFEAEATGSRTGYSDSFADENARRAGLKPAGVQVGVVYRLPIQPVPEAKLRYNYSVSILHELGHGFGLGHGGTNPDDGRWNNRNHKPNYPSIMNYKYQFWGVDSRDGLPVMDFSWGRFSEIAENRLSEIRGFGPVVPNAHLLEVIGVQQVDNAMFPHNLDWNGNGEVDLGLLHMDLDDNDRVDSESFRDHNDWEKFLRDGFDGIGLRAFQGCGPGCQSNDQVVRIPGDFNGDGRSDLLLFAGEGLALALSSGDGGMQIAEDNMFGRRVGSWDLAYADQMLVGDFDGDPGDELLVHRENRAALLDLAPGGVQTLWSGTEIVPRAEEPEEPNGAEPIVPWAFDKDDQLAVLPARNDAPHLVLASNNGEAAIIRWRDDRLLVEWSPPEQLNAMIGGEFPALLPGRSLEGGGRTFFARGSRSLVEFADRAGLFAARRIDVDGVIPHRSAEEGGWELSPADCLVFADLFGDRRDEIFIKSADRIGVLRELTQGLFLIWSADRELGPWTFQAADSMYRGQFIEGDGEEIIVSYRSSGGDAGGTQSWLALQWNHAESAVDIVAVADGEVRDPAGREPSWLLSPEQRIIPGSFVQGEPLLLLVQDRKSLLLARLGRGGFEQIEVYKGAVGSWSLSADDRMFPGNADSDSAEELFVRRDLLVAVLDFGSRPAARFIAEYEAASQEFREAEVFLRGDGNGDGRIDITDAFALLIFLFYGGKRAPCEDAADANDSGALDISDAIRLLTSLFVDGVPLPIPGPDVAGTDPTPDSLRCNGR